MPMWNGATKRGATSAPMAARGMTYPAAQGTWIAPRAAARAPMARPNPGWWTATGVGFERRPDAGGVGLGSQPVVFGVADGLRFVDEHDRDVVADGVAALEPRVVQRRFVGEVQQRPLVLGAGQDVEQFRVEGHGRQSAAWPMRSRTSAGCWRQDGPSRASRFRRRRGSVLLGRRLNHQSPWSTVRAAGRASAGAAGGGAA